ncbi:MULTISPECIES: DUF2798 domain-containing protein [Afipia]|uniref:Protein of uncharacterized function (DUF2798) n=2 Tax=Afipia felis TaxID=1035 RepID=A0A380W3A5_AFIFE|nr:MULTISPECIES: DUF2798 domain-containing protein [Afipia]EFI53272.1 conserved hypothetical protein [Afipia sp. 1NLS2]EKS30539.1 hypothetical protein HMPREF9697_03067 [Afipia felis ATCC 53690]SUU75284.1 Protein of uncharacterised function (DUF2798) [Afipia felis]SUU83350.1 Protein of uncharacterised function (DUF2798) [Afipia felis]
MLVPRKYSHYVFGMIQSGVTSGLAAGVATFGYQGERLFAHWMKSWLISWTLMVPLVLFAAPAIQRLTLTLTRERP